MAKISQNISSNSLFHFIRQKNWLIEVLHNKSFQARYVYEDMPELEYKAGIPMKCFCDIPLGLIKKHLNQYGKFGIGITKSFAKKNHLSPVIYLHANSDTFFRYISIVQENDVFENMFSLFPYIKLDLRITEDPNGKKTTHRYYDEREWRYVPAEGQLLNLSGLTDHQIALRLEEENRFLSMNRQIFALSFEYHDISYIFVQYDKDLDSVIEEIKKLSVSELQRDRLIAKIITSKQIERDF